MNVTFSLQINPMSNTILDEVQVPVSQEKSIEMQPSHSLGDKLGLPNMENNCLEVTGRQGRRGGPLSRLHLDFFGRNLGLPNPSNHCFINALLQCLLSLEGLRPRLERVRDGNPAADRLYKLLCAIENKDDSNRKNDLNKLKNELVSSIMMATTGVNLLKFHVG